ncbi:DppD2 [Desulforapulum autotrophicum HRM2]|uniref:DppD2 n=1 Tax=Desulforapulum autotrophicum (strain ATCC 43914 / DSM 3382 / VKM B-1955 / HRM2) TaxID=177437 RepID=C0QJD5_DESAH|nr:ABC transporter ATP-binding protein [Desulforapulum autotrophicum]ACN15948.1 DppD2 [Desulforapulum autotrophicum HRM2]
MISRPILTVKDLVVSFTVEGNITVAVDGVGFELFPGQTLGVVGESGCGKSVTALSIMGLLPRPAGRIESGSIEFMGQDLVTLQRTAMHQIRGKKISMIFQEPMTALNPVHRIGKQINEVYLLHFPEMSAMERNNQAAGMLTKVGIADPEKVLRAYPHQISGGMRQRVMIAMALCAEPDILIADEPTTALDVTVQAQILDLIKTLQKEMSMAVMLITHDLGVIAENCDNAVVMYGGQVAEIASVAQLFSSPSHPYTRGLLTSIPGLASTPKTILPTIDGMVPSLEDMPQGCRFSTRCPFVFEPCNESAPRLARVGPAHFSACYYLEAK